jgi:thiaminase/transcriptional activator TenA
MPWSRRLRAAADPIWQEIVTHPFIVELGRGTLAPERFRFFLMQDYPYLKEFARVLALAVSRGGRLGEMAFFAELAHGTLQTEMAIHRSYCADFGISEAHLESTRLAPTAFAYTRHLLSVGALGTEAEIMAALAPCMTTYAELGAHLAVKPPTDAPLYSRWIEAYASEPFQEIARRTELAFDRLEALAGPEERERCGNHYLTSFRYEWMFWEMSYRMEAWPLQGART